MTKAIYNDKSRIVDILTQSFEDNKSVNYIVKQDRNRLKRIKALMSYSFDVCYLFGDALLSDDKKACALIVYPHQKKNSLKSVWLGVKLAFNCIGISNLGKAMKREAAIRKEHPTTNISYLWFIGVEPAEQGKGIGTALMKQIISESEKLNRPIYLETSTDKNIPWYQKFGFKIYRELDFGYKLYCLRRE